MFNLKKLIKEWKAKLVLVSALLFVFLSFELFANQSSEALLEFDAASFNFTYTPNASAVFLTNIKKQYDIDALSADFWKLPTEKTYFELSYAYVKNYGRTYKEKVTFESVDSKVDIFSSAPLRKLSIANNLMPIHLLVKAENAGFRFSLSEKLINNFCNQEEICQIEITDITGKQHHHSYQNTQEQMLLPMIGIGFYGLPCTPSCTAFNSQSLSALSEHLNIKVVDVSNQQLIFNESILCESGVLNNCKNGLADNRNKNTLEWHVMENQLVVQQQEITKAKRFFQSEVLIAWINPMMSETRMVATVFVRHKNKQHLVELLAKKTAVIAKVILVSQP